MSFKNALASGHCQTAITMLTPKLRSHVSLSMERQYGKNNYMEKVKERLSGKNNTLQENLENCDFSVLLRVFNRFWRPVFIKGAHPAAKNLASKCIVGRNKLSHQQMIELHEYHNFLLDLLNFSKSVNCLKEITNGIQLLMDNHQIDGVNKHLPVNNCKRTNTNVPGAANQSFRRNQSARGRNRRSRNANVLGTNQSFRNQPSRERNRRSGKANAPGRANESFRENQPPTAKKPKVTKPNGPVGTYPSLLRDSPSTATNCKATQVKISGAPYKSPFRDQPSTAVNYKPTQANVARGTNQSLCMDWPSMAIHVDMPTGANTPAGTYSSFFRDLPPRAKNYQPTQANVAEGTHQSLIKDQPPTGKNNQPTHDNLWVRVEPHQSPRHQQLTAMRCQPTPASLSPQQRSPTVQTRYTLIRNQDFTDSHYSNTKNQQKNERKCCCCSVM